MLINLSVVLLIALSGYWFGFKEGFFSGVIHLICVVVSGAITFAFWEPLAMTMLPTGMGEFAWGLSFLGLFCFVLIILRIATNLLIPTRQNFPPMADYIGGTIVGIAAGVISAGMALIGVGFLPVGGNIAGELGMMRSSDAKGQPKIVKKIIPPVHEWVEKFYGTLSVGSFRPLVNSQSLAQDYPGLAEQSWSLLRDTASRGRIDLALSPEEVTVGAPYIGTLPNMGAREFYVIPITFEKGAYHRGDYLAVSASQAQIIGAAQIGTTPSTVFPEGWRQGNSPYYRFDDVSHYITNPPAQQSVKTSLAFPAAAMNGQIPKALMLRGTRFPLATPTDDIASIGNTRTKATDLVDSSAPMVPQPYISVGRQLGVEFSKNSKPQELILDQETRAVVAGYGSVPTTARGMISKSLKVNELYEPDGTKIVRVNLSRGTSPINIWDSEIRTKEGDDAEILLIDSTGQTYIPRGYLHRRDLDRVMVIELNPTEGIKRVRELPPLSTAGKDRLEVIFLVPDGRKIVGMKLGDSTVARFNFVAKR